MQKNCMNGIGRNLDICIETHIHGKLSLLDDNDTELDYQLEWLKRWREQCENEVCV
jgi:hypothetical protein